MTHGNEQSMTTTTTIYVHSVTGELFTDRTLTLQYICMTHKTPAYRGSSLGIICKCGHSIKPDNPFVFTVIDAKDPQDNGLMVVPTNDPIIDKDNKKNL